MNSATIPDTETKLEPIQAVQRAMQVLECISQAGSMSLADLHKSIKVNKASLLRLTHTLTECGYLKKDAASGLYSITIKMFEVGTASIKSIDKFSFINTILADLSDATGRIAQFSIEDNNELICLQSIGQKTDSFSVYTNVGKRSPLYCTSAGKALLASYSNADVMEKWNHFNIKQLTEHTITDVQSLLADLQETRDRQYALDMEENEYHVFCVGSAVLGSDGKPIGSISISGRTLTPEEEEDISKKLLNAVKLLSGMMGYIAF